MKIIKYAISSFALFVVFTTTVFAGGTTGVSSPTDAERVTVGTSTPVIIITAGVVLLIVAASYYFFLRKKEKSSKT